LCEYAVLFLVNHCRDGSVPDFSLVRCACGGGAAMMAASALILALWPNFFLIMIAAILPGNRGALRLRHELLLACGDPIKSTASPARSSRS